MYITDRPGRFYALCILSPTLVYSGIIIKKDNNKEHNKKYNKISSFLIFNGTILFLYELFWLSFKNDETIL
jgi:hypothetical protein